MKKNSKFISKKILLLEIIFSFFVIMSIIFVITVVCVKMNLEIQLITKNSEASIIITNMLENISSKTYSEFESYINEVSIIGISKKMETNTQNISINGDECVNKFLGTDIPNGYNIDIEISNSDDFFNLVKTININVKYLINNKEYNKEIKTVLKRETIAECNSPIISDEYFSDIEINTEEYDIIPIKYSNEENSYIVTTIGDRQWYNYSSKEWAKILVFLKSEEHLKNQFISLNGHIKSDIIYDNHNLSISEYMYIWIPNFSIKDDISYFRYRAEKNSIKMDLIYTNEQYLNINTVGEKIEDISEECSFEGVYGVWRRLNNIQDAYYNNFNLTKYAPVNMHFD